MVDTDEALAALSQPAIYDALHERLAFVERSCVRMVGIKAFTVAYRARAAERSQLLNAIVALEALLTPKD